jgi:hypothetical protein
VLELKYAANEANVKIPPRKRTIIDINRADLGKTRQISKRRTITAAINKINATIERPADGVEQPVQNKPKVVVHRGVASAIIQKSADINVITAVIISRIVSLICMASVRFVSVLF